jgi:hypothetical protein
MLQDDLTMRDDDGRKLDRHTLVQIRVREVDRVAEDYVPRPMAKMLGMHKHTV